MKLAFSTKDLRTVCECQVSGEREFGTTVARAFRTILADLQAARNLKEVLQVDTNQIDEKARCRLQLPDGYAIELGFPQVKLPLSDKQNMDGSKITRVFVHTIEQSR